MQMFNGLNMGMIKIYGLNFDTPEIGNDAHEDVDYQKGLSDINSRINTLSDDTIDQNDTTAKTELNDMLSDSFNSGLINSLNEEQRVQLKSSIKKLLDAHNGETNFQEEYRGLINLAKALNIPEYSTSNERDNQAAETTGIEYGLKGNLGEIVELGKDEQGNKLKTKGKIFGNIDQEKPVDNEGNSHEKSSELGKTKENIKQQIDKITALTVDENKTNLPQGHKLEDTKKLLEDFQKIIENPISQNVKALQSYIYENLGDVDKIDFATNNHMKNSTFDGQFGKSTLNGLDKVLEKTGNYISSFEKSGDQLDSKDVFKDVNLKSEVDLSSLDGNVGAENFFNSLPEGISATFKDSKGVNVNNTEDQEVVVVLEKDGNTKEITLVVKREDSKLTIEEKSSDSSQNDVEGDNLDTKSQPTSSTPLDLNDQKFQVMQNSSALASSTGLTGVTFYSTTPFSGENPTDGQWGFTEATTNNKNGDYEYYVKFGDNSEPYKIKVDGNGNLCPIMDNPSNNEVGTLLMRNTSCINYLKNKAGNLGGDCRIGWSEEKHDYCIDSYGRSLTIEPMTIDGKWVSEDLGENLALLNFTNFLRSGGDINGVKLKGPDPDLKIDDEGNLKVRVEKSKESNSKKWIVVPKDQFGLGGVKDDVLKKFVKYNNHEDWMDDWDRKKPNKYYKKVDAEGLGVKITDNSATPPQGEPTTPPQGEPKHQSGEGTVEGQVTTPQPVQDFEVKEDATDSEGTQNFEGTIDPSLIGSRMDGARVDAINKVAGQNMLNFSETDGAKTLKYNMANIKGFLEDNVSKDFKTYCTKKPSNVRYAWISAVQIVLNNINGDDNKLVVDGERGPKTRNKVVEFQKANGKITVDGIPGPMTIKAMLDKAGSPTVTDGADDNVPVVENGGQVATGEIDKANELGLTQADPQPNKGDLNIPDGSVVYTRAGEGDSLYYKGSDSKVYRISTNYPYQKTEVDSSLNDGNVSVNVCKSGSNSLKIRFSDDEKVKRYLCDSGSGAPNINVLVTDEGNYQFENGEIKITINTNDPVYNSEGFCGLSVIYDRFKLVSLASIVKSKCGGNNVKYDSDKGLIVDGGSEDVLASNDVLKAFWGIDGDGDVNSTNIDSFVSYCNGLKAGDQATYAYSNEAPASGTHSN